MDSRKNVNEIFSAALRAVNPFLMVKEYIDKIYSEFINNKFKQIFLIGFGKASYQMAKAVEESIETDLITEGIVITKYGHIKSSELKVKSLKLNTQSLTPDSTGHSSDSSKIRVIEAGHPIPDEHGFKATEEIISLLKTADMDALILCLISGGGSALFVSPYGRITLDEKQRTTEMLLNAGADIAELNTVRKHISQVKGGRLAEIAHPAKVITLILSDVIGNKLDVIASGPTAPDTTTFLNALNVIKKFNLTEKVPKNVIDILNKGKQGLIPETPKEDNPVFKSVKNIIIGNNQKALNAAKNRAQALGLQTEIISSDITGEARDIGKWLAEKAMETKGTKSPVFPCGNKEGGKAQSHVPDGTRQRQKGTKCLISGGETTVTVKGKGKGGRNTELALSFAMAIKGVKGITMLSAGTDGTDGSTDAAGAVVDGKTIAKAKSLGLNPEAYLDNNDSYTFFKQTESLLITGPTGTNVMDVQIILVE